MIHSALLARSFAPTLIRFALLTPSLVLLAPLTHLLIFGNVCYRGAEAILNNTFSAFQINGNFPKMKALPLFDRKGSPDHTTMG